MGNITCGKYILHTADKHDTSDKENARDISRAFAFSQFFLFNRNYCVVINLLAVVVETTGLARCREAGRPPILLSNKSEAFVAHDNSAFGCTSFFTNISLYKLIACLVLAAHC